MKKNVEEEEKNRGREKKKITHGLGCIRHVNGFEHFICNCNGFLYQLLHFENVPTDMQTMRDSEARRCCTASNTRHRTKHRRRV